MCGQQPSSVSLIADSFSVLIVVCLCDCHKSKPVWKEYLSHRLLDFRYAVIGITVMICDSA